jgi:hypothetical protein
MILSNPATDDEPLVHSVHMHVESIVFHIKKYSNSGHERSP